MTKNQIKKEIERSANENYYLLYTDRGQGSAGANCMHPNTARDMLSNGDFDDLTQVDFDKSLFDQAHKDVFNDRYRGDLTPIQAEYSTSGNYCQTIWVFCE